MQALQIHPEKCTGCRQCELACGWVQAGAFQPARSVIRVHVFDEEASYAPWACFQCREAWCMQACPVNAIDVDAATGAKIVIDAVCVGCKLCTIACPFGTIFFDPAAGREAPGPLDHGRGVAAKCDLCAGDPACAHACPTGAIVVGAADAGGWVAPFGAKVDGAFRRAIAGEGA
jgi:Fe-S-cluster-containing hydrogenase component 2